MPGPVSYKLMISTLAVALISGHIVQNPRLWGEDSVSRHDDTLFIEPGTVRLASVEGLSAKFESINGPEFELPLPPVASLTPVKPLPKLPMMSFTSTQQVRLINFDLPDNRIDAYGLPCNHPSALAGTFVTDVNDLKPCNEVNGLQARHIKVAPEAEASPDES